MPRKETSVVSSSLVNSLCNGHGKYCPNSQYLLQSSHNTIYQYNNNNNNVNNNNNNNNKNRTKHFHMTGMKIPCLWKAPVQP